MKTQTPKIEQTSNYSLFAHNPDQAPMTTMHVKRIASSMRKIGFIAGKPIQVFRGEDGKFIVIDGHNRLEAAKMTGTPLLYVVESAEMANEIGRINFLVKKWSNNSFINLHSSRGNDDYKTLRYFIHKGIPSHLAASILRGESAHSGNSASHVREGTFKVKSTEAAETIVYIFERCDQIAPNIKKRSYIEALSMLLFVPEFDHNTLIKRIEVNPLGIVPCANRVQALESIEQVYNFRSRQTVPLAYLAKESARKRNAIKK